MRARLLRSTNPMMRRVRNNVHTSDTPVTYGGIATKTIFLFALLLLSGYTTSTYFNVLIDNTWIFFAALIGGFISVMVASFSPRLAKFFAPLYAILEGVILGALVLMVSLFVDASIPQTAVLITVNIFGVMLILYTTGIIRVGNFLRRFVMSALSGLIIFMLVMRISAIFGGTLATMYYTNLNFMLVISLVSAGIATLMLLIDFDNCTQMVNAGVDKEYEWSLGLGLMVTLVWLFIEILRILMIFASRRD